MKPFGHIEAASLLFGTNSVAAFEVISVTLS